MKAVCKKPRNKPILHSGFIILNFEFRQREDKKLRIGSYIKRIYSAMGIGGTSGHQMLSHITIRTTGFSFETKRNKF